MKVKITATIELDPSVTKGNALRAARAHVRSIIKEMEDTYRYYLPYRFLEVSSKEYGK